MRLAAVPVVFSAALFLGIFLPHAAGSFFLYDDFAILAGAPGLGFRELMTRETGGFFRPVAVLLFGWQSQVFGWNSPAGYAVISLALHTLNAALVALLLGRFGADRAAAIAGFALFFASPWAGEAFFWTSAQFDLLATAAVLGTCLLGSAYLEAAGPRRGMLAAAALACAALALLSKESAVPIPALFLTVVAARPFARPPSRKLAAAVSVLATLVVGYLLLRSRVLPGLEGPYGRFGDLVKASHLLENAMRFGRAFVQLPLPRYPLLPTGAAFVLTVLWTISLGRLLRQNWRRAAALLLGFAVSLTPVVFVGLEPGSTAGGRLLYLPGVFAVCLFVIAWHRSSLAPVAVALILALSLPSLVWQNRLWSAAADLSRAAVERFGAALPSARPIWVLDLPSTFEEGPYVLKAYAFRCFFGERLTVPVRAEAIVLGWRDGGPVALRSMPDPFSDPPQRDELTLSLGVVPAER